MNLTEISYFIRKYGILIVLGGIFVILLIFTLNLLIRLSNQTKQPTTTKNKLEINPVFGKIKLPKLETEQTISPNIEFILDTIEGVPITASNSAQVLKFEKTTPVLTYLERSYLMAKTLGFDTEKLQPTRQDTLINFETTEKQLEIQITDFSFKYQLKNSYLTQIAQNLSIANLTENDLVTIAKEKLNEVNKYTDNLINGKMNLTYLKIDETGKFKVTETKQSANSLRIDLYPNDINGIPIITEDYDKSPNYIIVALETKQIPATEPTNQTDNQNQDPEQTPTPTPTPIIESRPIIISASIQDKDFSNEIGVYPLITGDQAWQNLKEKKAIITLKPGEDTTKIEISKMFLGYLYAPDKSEYLLPYYVFLGKDFIAYVPAITPEYIESN
ncbi:MAG: hypothetical protein KatS3mg090_0231 [Patescibacteria group bacterium]|nr:MAG: hypothetical protein KatS3mg090_0231 [Patescibacteria group bacterium]